MRSFLTVFFSAAMVMTAVSPVLASETRVLPANRASGLGFFYTGSQDDCSSGAKPKFHLTGKPAHGSVTSAWKGFRIGKEGGVCTGKPAHGTLVVYRPNPGYHGSDRVSFVLSEGEGNDYIVSPKEYVIDIEVK